MANPDALDPDFIAVSAAQASATLPFRLSELDEVRRNRTAVMGPLEGRRAADVTRQWDGPLTTVTPKIATGGTILFIHGGGWVVCDTVTHGAIMTDLAATSGARVPGLDYPLAPEAPYPAALDALAACAAELARDGGLVLAGDSAGANLALGLAARLRDEGGARARGMILFYGCYRRLFDTGSHRAFGDGRFGLTTEAMRTYWDLYLGESAGRPYGDLSGLDMAGLPPAFIGDAALDVLRDDGDWLARGLGDAGVPVVRQIVPGVPHGFLHHTGRYDPAFGLIAAAGRWAGELISG